MNNGEVANTETVETQIYLKRVRIDNFRSLNNFSIDFKNGINVIVGPNNVGKSAVIDAIRATLDLGKYRKSAYVKRWDFYDETKEVAVDLYFDIPEDTDGFHELLALEEGERELQLHARFKLVGLPDNPRVMPHYWGGGHTAHKLDENALGGLHATYLGALRNANSELRPSTLGPLAELLRKLCSTDFERKEIEKVFAEAHYKHEVESLVKTAKGSIDSHLSPIVLEADKFNVRLDPISPDFDKLVGNFEMRLENTTRTMEVFQNGMGYNNILYISTVLGHIQQSQRLNDDEYFALLIEEPEAHLHPQLEDSLFNYMCSLGIGSGAQIITTTHSPIIASQCDLDSVNIMSMNPSAAAVSIGSLGLSDETKMKLTRFLDVTKSQMLFAKAIMLVEGISEALLMPFMANCHYDTDHALTKKGVEVVNVNGLSFATFATLFNQEKCLPIRTAILSDKDDFEDEEGVYHEMSATAQIIASVEGGYLKSCISHDTTFEIDLWNAGNDKIMKKVYEGLHPRTTIDSGEKLVEKLTSNQDKALFAQELAYRLEKDDIKLTPPDYIIDAFDWIAPKAEDEKMIGVKDGSEAHEATV